MLLYVWVCICLMLRPTTESEDLYYLFILHQKTELKE